LLKKWGVDDPGQWSRYENPGGRHHMAEACARIEEVFARRGWPLPQLPVVGTLTTGQVSAVTQKTARGAPLVLIDNGFFRFAGIMSQLAVFAPYDMHYRKGFTEPTLQLICDVAATHTVLNTCLYAYVRATPDKYRALVDNYQNAVVLFVLAHEYAHVSVGDLDSHPAKGGPRGGILREKEFEADKRGFQVCLDTILELDGGYPAFHGAFLYLCGLDLLARAAAAYAGRREPYESASRDEYPTPFERTVNLLNWLGASPYGSQFANQIKSASDCYNIILFGWDIILPVFWACREQMAEFAKRGSGRMLPEALTFGLVHNLWQEVLAHIRRPKG
jgi:hypothetical protein